MLSEVWVGRDSHNTIQHDAMWGWFGTTGRGRIRVPTEGTHSTVLSVGFGPYRKGARGSTEYEYLSGVRMTSIHDAT